MKRKKEVELHHCGRRIAALHLPKLLSEGDGVWHFRFDSFLTFHWDILFPSWFDYALFFLFFLKSLPFPQWLQLTLIPHLIPRLPDGEISNQCAKNTTEQFDFNDFFLLFFYFVVFFLRTRQLICPSMLDLHPQWRHRTAVSEWVHLGRDENWISKVEH